MCTRCRRMARSQAQRAHARLSMAKINAGNKENDISSSGGISDGNNSHSGNSGPSNSALRIARVRVLESKRLLHNTRRKLTRAENTKDKLRTQAKDALSDAKSSQEKLSRAELVIASLKRPRIPSENTTVVSRRSCRQLLRISSPTH